MYQKYVKRVIDFLIALVSMPFVFLVIIVMAPIIYINDPGPIFYNADRRGRDGKTFKMFKLRSMYVNSADIKNADGSTFNSGSDPRVTGVGRFMRKMSIDEIPQIINVLIGDMSFVGPRPTLAETPYSELSDVCKKRLIVRPGITGYSQAYYRNSITQDEKFMYDCEYVDKISFIFDIKILIRTVKSVLKTENIYVSQESRPTEEKENVTK